MIRSTVKDMVYFNDNEKYVSSFSHGNNILTLVSVIWLIDAQVPRDYLVNCISWINTYKNEKKNFFFLNTICVTKVFISIGIPMVFQMHDLKLPQN